MPKKKALPSRPRDLNQLAAHIVALATHEIEETDLPQPDASAVKRGVARAKKLSAAERSAIAKRAAEARWSKKK